MGSYSSIPVSPSLLSIYLSLYPLPSPSSSPFFSEELAVSTNLINGQRKNERELAREYSGGTSQNSIVPVVSQSLSQMMTNVYEPPGIAWRCSVCSPNM